MWHIYHWNFHAKNVALFFRWYLPIFYWFKLSMQKYLCWELAIKIFQDIYHLFTLPKFFNFNICVIKWGLWAYSIVILWNIMNWISLRRISLICRVSWFLLLIELMSRIINRILWFIILMVLIIRVRKFFLGTAPISTIHTIWLIAVLLRRDNK